MKESKKLQRIGVLTSGGDAPGMNACIRAVVRTALSYDIQVTGIHQGYQGLIDGNFSDMDRNSVSNIIQKGGTILKTARCMEFKTKEGRQKAFDNAKAAGIDGLIVIGGDGSFTGALNFSNEFDIPVIGIPGTIDNDLYGTDFTIGYDTANNTAIEAIDKIRDTADSHDRLFFIEVMGRDSGCIALNAGIAGGAEAILLPEKQTSIEELIEQLQEIYLSKKTSSIVIVAEGDKNGGAYEVAEKVKAQLSYFDTKVSILGHLQRGGAPTSFDRVLASRLGFAAVKELLKGNSQITVGLRGTEVNTTPLKEAINNKEIKLNEDLLEMAHIL